MSALSCRGLAASRPILDVNRRNKPLEIYTSFASQRSVGRSKWNQFGTLSSVISDTVDIFITTKDLATNFCYFESNYGYLRLENISLYT